MIPRATLAWSLKACAIARFSKSARARLKTIGSHLNMSLSTSSIAILLNARETRSVNCSNYWLVIPSVL